MLDCSDFGVVASIRALELGVTGVAGATEATLTLDVASDDVADDDSDTVDETLEEAVELGAEAGKVLGVVTSPPLSTTVGLINVNAGVVP